MPAQDTSFSRLISLACHDLRTPLATVTGFAKTMVRMEGVDEKIARYLGMIDAAGGQLADLLEELALAARIEGGRWDPLLGDVDSLEFARAAVDPLGEAVYVGGAGTQVTVARDDAARTLEALTRCALRHGGLERVELQVDGAALTISPVTAETAAICLGRELRDFGAAVAVRVIDALGGSTEPEGEAIVVRLPVAGAAG
jgi:signal transduction histidine kinase